MSELLDPEIYAFEGRDFADWFEAGILRYLGFWTLPPGRRMPDAFPYAQLFIGRNERDLAEDLKDVCRALPPPSSVAFRRGIQIAWSNLEFCFDHDFKLADHLLILACRVRAKAIVEALAGKLPWLAAAANEDATRRWAAFQTRKRAFQAAVELATSSTASVLCIERFVMDGSFDEPLLEGRQALTIVRYLAENAGDCLPYWCAIFGDAIVADINADATGVGEVRRLLEESYGSDVVQDTIDMVRIDGISRLATEGIALGARSMGGLYDLVSRIDSEAAGGLGPRAVVTSNWQAVMERARAGGPSRREAANRTRRIVAGGFDLNEIRASR